MPQPDRPLQRNRALIRKAVILAGGLGTRLMEETGTRPKPMVEIGGQPILWHIMRSYHAHGIGEFIVCLGYKGYVIKEWFHNYHLHAADVTFDLAANAATVHRATAEPLEGHAGRDRAGNHDRRPASPRA